MELLCQRGFHIDTESTEIYDDEMRPKGSRNKRGVSRVVTKDGYIDVFEPLHPMAKANGYVAEHRKVWFDAGRVLREGHHLHHKNWDKQDNRLENLEELTASEHATRYNSGGWETRRRKRKADTCQICGKEHFGYFGLCVRCYRSVWAHKKHGYKSFRNPKIYAYFKQEGFI